ncbi:MAG: 4Fe-4S binding protein [Anaerolineaceae bacterium]|nr:4Fe-4S binding protein [Anaerolineaceae bacterium]
MKKKNDQSPSLMDQVREIPGGEYVSICYSCGTCVSRCLIQQKIDKAYNPRRMMKMVMMGMSEEAFESPTAWLCSSCDLCYPACPQEIHISGVITAVKKLALETGYHSPLKTARVNIKTCVGCGLCVEVCPYEAVHLVEKNIPNRGKNMAVAEVDSGLCMACGLCSSVCRSNSIELTEDYTDEIVVDSLSSWLMEKAAKDSA